ncbi:uncharacterized protein LOC132611264 [Lycium barbarum]|uniref:uncharacterized protein LOC132611264 n=1 Tax=Lycium barbarum TaxID=112863 RepID=UPI00293E50D7|nr:uncharacterized protein LOC132611264 [Lycium barbarum]
MLSKVLRKVEPINSIVKEAKDDMKNMRYGMRNMGKIVCSHSTYIKKLESQLSQILATINQRQKGTLPSDTVTNPKNDGEHACKAIATRSGKVLGEEKLVKEDIVVDDETLIVELIIVEEENTPNKKRVSVEKLVVIEGVPANEEIMEVLTPIPKPPLPFPQGLEKKTNDGKIIKFIEKLMQLSINIPLVEALKQMPGYAKFVKDLVTKKRQASFEMMDVTHNCSSIITKALV